MEYDPGSTVWNRGRSNGAAVKGTEAGLFRLSVPGCEPFDFLFCGGEADRDPGGTSGSSALPAFERRVYPHSDENHRHHLYCRVCF